MGTNLEPKKLRKMYVNIISQNVRGFSHEKEEEFIDCMGKRDVWAACLQETWRIERPKIVYNKRNDNYVILFHLDAPNFALSSIGIAVAPKIDGPYTWVRGFKPDGKDVYDMTAFVDRDGKGYVVAAPSIHATGARRNNDGTTELAPNFSSLGVHRRLAMLYVFPNTMASHY
jgi:hypothetical protein